MIEKKNCKNGGDDDQDSNMARPSGTNYRPNLSHLDARLMPLGHRCCFVRGFFGIWLAHWLHRTATQVGQTFQQDELLDRMGILGTLTREWT